MSAKLQPNYSSGNANADILTVNKRLIVAGPIVPKVGAGDNVLVESNMRVGGGVFARAQTIDYNEHTTWSYTPIAPLSWSPVPNNVSHALDLLKAGSGGVPSLSNGLIFVGNSSNIATPVSMSGDALLSNAGVINVTNISGPNVGGTGLKISSTSGVNSSIYFGYTSTLPTALQNIGIGYQALNVATGVSNIAIGNSTGSAITSGYENVIIGHGTGSAIINGYENVIIGHNAAPITTNTDNSVIIGNSAASGLVNGYENVYIGTRVANSDTGGVGNVAVGFEAMRSNIGAFDCVVIGNKAMRDATDGTNNTVVGPQSMISIKEATNCTTLGYRSMVGVTNAIIDFNTAIGTESLRAVNTGANNNTALGYRSGYNVSTGTNNTLSGYQSGITLTTGGNNTLIGHGANVTASSTNNAVAVGSGASADTNMLALGTGAVAAAHSITNAPFSIVAELADQVPAPAGAPGTATHRLRININGINYTIALYPDQ